MKPSAVKSGGVGKFRTKARGSSSVENVIDFFEQKEIGDNMRKVCKEDYWRESEGTCVNELDVKDRELLGKQVRDVLGDRYIADYIAELLQCDVLPKGKVEDIIGTLENTIRLNSADIDAKIIADEVELAIKDGNVKTDKDKIWIGFDEDSGDLLLAYIKEYTEEKEKLRIAKRILNIINNGFKCD